MSDSDLPTFDALYTSRYGYRPSAHCVTAWNAALEAAVTVASQTKDRLVNNRDYEAAAAARDVQELLGTLLIPADAAS